MKAFLLHEALSHISYMIFDFAQVIYIQMITIWPYQMKNNYVSIEITNNFDW